jgi:small-conductance mechanosensitive channel
MGRSNERKAQLLTIMRAHRERATCTSEFTRIAIAHEAGVTPQYLSMLIGPEFQAAAQGLPGARRTAETTLREALADNKRLRRELGQVRQQLNDLTRQSIDEALRLIDQLDEDNRLLRGRVRVLEQRLRQREIAIPANGLTQPRARPSLGLVPTAE